MKTRHCRLQRQTNGERKIVVDVLCLGVACYDLIFSVEQHVGPDEKVRASELTSCGGGLAANAAITIARLGYSVAFAGYLGQDLYGDEHLHELHEAGVNTALVVRGQWPTSLSAIFVKPDGSRTLVNYGGGHDLPIGAEFHLDLCRPQAILVDGYHLAAAEPLITWARTRGIPTVLDGDTVHVGSKRLMEKVEFLVTSEHFARDFSGQADPQIALAQLSRYAPSVVITLGQLGLIWYNRDDCRFGASAGSYSAFTVPVEDTTGAGDAFHGAFAAGLSQKMPWEELLRFSSAVGALCCTKKGARPGIPSRAEVAEFLQSHPNDE